VQVGIGLANTWRVIGFDPETPFTVYANVPLSASLKLNVAVPTGAVATFAELNGTSLNPGPVVW
jgi:hypothetical protein